MKASFLLASVGFVTLDAKRLLTQAGCSTVRCGLGGPCYDDPFQGTPVCCPDTFCTNEEYSSDTTMVLCEDGNVYPNICYADCVGQAACTSVCTCDATSDCESGYECLETPYGFAGCDENLGNSCYGFCVAVGSSCGGVVGLSQCTADETCYYTTNFANGNNVGYCGSLPDTCLEETPSPTIATCDSFPNCATFNDGCNTCQCFDNGLAACTKMFCQDYADAFCTSCEDGYDLSATGDCEASVFCTQDVMTCPDGSFVSRDPENGCAFSPCPTTCCPVADFPSLCREGVECCPNGEWSCSIGDAKTYPCESGFLVVDQDTFGESCPTLVACENNRDCSGSFKCRIDPESSCRGQGCSGVEKYCLRSGASCSTDPCPNNNWVCVGGRQGDTCVLYQA